MKNAKSRLFAGAIVALFVFGLFLQSCSSNSATPVTGSDNAVPMVSANASGLIVPDFAVDQSGFDNSVAMDPTPGGGTGRDTTVKGGGPDTSKGGGSGNSGPGNKGSVRMRPLPIPCLGLDSAQMAQLRQIMADAAAASKAAADAYRLAMAPVRTADSIAMAAYRESTKDVQKQLQDLQKSYRQKAADVMAQVKAGTMSRADAQVALQALKDEFAAASKALVAQLTAAREALRTALSANDAQRKAANDAYQAALKQIQTDMNAKIAAMLTPEQLALWNLWLSGGDPCKGKGPRK